MIIGRVPAALDCVAMARPDLRVTWWGVGGREAYRRRSPTNYHHLATILTSMIASGPALRSADASQRPLSQAWPNERKLRSARLGVQILFDVGAVRRVFLG